ncbi:MAG: nitrate ABC transporter substrate-binding protein [Candidatus Anoxymicrobium japonicum]|uniref:Nitrate ABC transporter substrate-binding protein n=1 Tax=Candidatus Anoxymicrobium japonicum TaxID=2013648 RepID=A0A2N3G5T7_9ACTN|nr:MAG: nitrate ABC transporter substrate-binding protein [Candidatus Anoxymicrobium japonicum]
MKNAKRGQTLFCVLLLLSLLAGFIAGGCGAAPKTTKVVRVGFLRNDLHQLAYYVAREKGFFTEQGLDIREGGAFNAGPEEMSAFSAGELDIGYVGMASCVTFASQNMADVKIVAQANANGSSIMVRPGLDAGDVSALRGRTVAIPGMSTLEDFLLRTALQKAGVDPVGVNIIVVKPPEMISALATAQVDATIACEPYPSMAHAQKAGRVLENSSKIWPRHPCCVVVADAAFMDRNPDAVRRFVAAHVKATEYIKKNIAEASSMAHLFTGQESAVVNSAMKNIRFDYRPETKAITKYVEFMKRAGVVKQKNPSAFTRNLVDARFLPGRGS